VVDNERLAWLDPFREEAWDYVIAVAREAASKGFQGSVRLPPLSR
jgi:hypothetical protein